MRKSIVREERARARAFAADFCAPLRESRFSHRAPLRAHSSVPPRLQLIVSIFSFSRVISRAIPHYVIPPRWAPLRARSPLSSTRERAARAIARSRVAIQISAREGTGGDESVVVNCIVCIRGVRCKARSWSRCFGQRRVYIRLKKKTAVVKERRIITRQGDNAVGENGENNPRENEAAARLSVTRPPYSTDIAPSDHHLFRSAGRFTSKTERLSCSSVADHSSIERGIEYLQREWREAADNAMANV